MDKIFQIRVLFFAALREQVGQGECLLDLTEAITIREVWERIVPELSMPGNALVACNQEYSKPEHIVSPGDEIAFFPPVTGG